MTRGVGPGRISAWAVVAQDLADDLTTAEAGFIVAFAAWEALRTRTLAVALYRQGYTMKVAHSFLGDSSLNDRVPVSQLAPIIFGRNPHSLPGAGRYWSRMDGWSRHRNGLVHGLTTYNPESLQHGAFEMLGLLTDTAWLRNAPVPLALGGPTDHTVALGDVLSNQRSGSRNREDAHTLARKIRDLRKAGKGSG